MSTYLPDHPEQPEHPTRFRTDNAMPRFWPARPSPFWMAVSDPIRRYFAHTFWRIGEVDIGRIEALYQRFGPNDGVLIAPNHSHEGDGHVLQEASRHLKRPFYYMAAWEAFQRHWGIDGWFLQRWGAFSIDRESTDRRALREAVDLLSGGQTLVIFPEGEIHHLNERLRPLLDGVALIALNAQRKLERAGADARVWLVPTAIRYHFIEDVGPQLEAAMKRLEARLFWWKPPRGASMPERILSFGEALLTLKEKEKLGKSRENEDDLAGRLAYLTDALLAHHESKFLGKSQSGEKVALRVKGLRRRLVELLAEETVDRETRLAIHDALDDIQLSLQAYSYPGNYILENPTQERMAETIEKFEEDIYGRRRSIGRRRAQILFGEPMDMKQESRVGSGREVVPDLTDRLEQEIRALLAAPQSDART
jgi:hypothetical protein